MFLMQHLVNMVGERRSLIALDVFAIFIVSYQAYHIQVHQLYITRFLLGIYLGISSSILASYLVSLSPPELSGLIGSFQQVLITVGIAVAYRLGYTK